jgi:hypothetical protein
MALKKSANILATEQLKLFSGAKQTPDPQMAVFFNY